MRARLVDGSPRHLAGWRPSKPDHRDRLVPRAPGEPADRNLSASWGPIFDQGQLGSCTGNGTAGVMRWLAALSGVAFTPARLFLYYFGRLIEGTPATEDSGCEIRDVVKAAAIYGAPDESIMPYSDDPGEFSKAPSDDATAAALKHQVQFYYRCPDLATIRASIAQGHPVVFGFTVYESMFDDAVSRTGVILMPGLTDSVAGGHCVVAVGADSTKRMVKIANSWGEGWGDHGFGYLPFDYFAQGLATDAWTIRREEL